MNTKPSLKKHAPSFIPLAVVLAGTLFAHPAAAKTFVIPHVLEKSGTINNTSFTFDTTLFLTYNAS
ncbi:MAG: hypothetical protein JWR69_4326, partial [Pedosphaera sp.]|nr:hypothetical protein [Pedosphaera sp.]